MAKSLSSPAAWPGGSSPLREPRLSSTIKIKSKKPKFSLKVKGIKSVKGIVPLKSLMSGITY